MLRALPLLIVPLLLLPALPASAEETRDLQAFLVRPADIFPNLQSPISFRTFVITDGFAEGEAFDAEFFVDGVSIGTTTTTVGFFPIMTVRSPTWDAPSLGSHEVRVVLDPAGLVAEDNEANNVATDTFDVFVGVADVTVANLTFETLGTTLEPEYAISYTLCNEGNGPAEFASAHVVVRGQEGLVLKGGGEDAFFGETLTGLAPGACASETIPWEPQGFVGDVEVALHVTAYPEIDIHDNAAETSGYVLVGGLGGTYLDLP